MMVERGVLRELKKTAPEIQVFLQTAEMLYLEIVSLMRSFY